MKTAEKIKQDLIIKWGIMIPDQPLAKEFETDLNNCFKAQIEAITDTAIKLEFSRSRCNHIHPDRFKEQGALWLKNELLKP